jgi:type I restriction-modification system DNA methylase subunit
MKKHMSNVNDQHIQSIIDELRANKERAIAQKSNIKYNPIKPKTSKMSTPILEDLYPRVELAE